MHAGKHTTIEQMRKHLIRLYYGQLTFRPAISGMNWKQAAAMYPPRDRYRLITKITDATVHLAFQMNRISSENVSMWSKVTTAYTQDNDESLAV